MPSSDHRPHQQLLQFLNLLKEVCLSPFTHNPLDLTNACLSLNPEHTFLSLLYGHSHQHLSPRSTLSIMNLSSLACETPHSPVCSLVFLIPGSLCSPYSPYHPFIISFIPIVALVATHIPNSQSPSLIALLGPRPTHHLPSRRQPLSVPWASQNQMFKTEFIIFFTNPRIGHLCYYHLSELMASSAFEFPSQGNS